MSRPKVLHVWNAGRIATILAHEYPGSVVLLTGRAQDLFRAGMDEATTYCGSAEGLAEQAVRRAPDFDVVHIHALDWLLPKIREIHPDAKIVLHHHGQNLREEDPATAQRLAKLADVVLVATPDLQKLIPGSTWLPNPIDERLFKKTEWQGYGDLFPVCYERTLPYVDQVKAAIPGVTCWIRWRNPVPYFEMPSFLSGFEREISWKPEVDYSAMPEKVLSLTDLESLMLGKQVYYWMTKETLEGFPERHRLENVVKQLDQVYEELLR